MKGPSKKYLILFVALAGFLRIHAQTIVYITDTNSVRTSVDPSGDTIYSLIAAGGLKIKNGIRYVEMNALTGTWVAYFDSSQKQMAFSKTFLSQNRYNYQSWYRNGQQRQLITNVDSMPPYRQNEQEWNENGQLLFSVTFFSDSSVTYRWDKNGKVTTIQKSIYAQPWNEINATGFSVFNLPDGMIDSSLYFADSTIRRTYFPSGKMAGVWKSRPDKTFPHGCREYYTALFYESGQLYYEVYPDRGRQPVVYYYTSGKIKAECEYDQTNIGHYKEYYENGVLKAEGEYRRIEKHFPGFDDGQYVNYCSVKTGNWKYYSPKGRLQSEELYNGYDYSFKIYNRFGHVKESGEKKLPSPPGCGYC